MTSSPRSYLSTSTSISPARASDHAALHRLWQLFRHDMSQTDGALPSPDGRYRTERLDTALSDDTTWQAWILRADDHPIGLCVIRNLDQPVRVLNSFFVIAAVRRARVGTAFARTVLRSYPGRWTMAYQDANTSAARFWPTVAETVDSAATHQHRAVPGRPDLPPESWLNFTVRDEVTLSEPPPSAQA